jgi:hypothetical protein
MNKNDTETPDVVDKNPGKSLAETIQTIAIGFTIFITIGTTFLIALGYGVAVEVENKFGTPHASLYESVFDLIDLGFFFSVNYSLLLAFGVLCFLGLILFVYKLTQIKSFRKNLQSPNFFNFEKGSAKGAWLVGIIGIFGLPLSIILLLIFITILLCNLVIPVQCGTIMADIHFNNYVIGAKQCKSGYFSNEKPVQNPDKQTGKSKEYAINCVIVTNGKEEIGRGYVALSTSKSLLLYNPKTHEAVRVPTENAKIQTVTDLSE